MAASNSAVTSIGQGEKVAGFAKLQGQNFVYFMQSYSVILGRNSESYTIDFDLSKYECGSQRVSHRHARIFYDFDLHHFALEVLGRNGCTIQGVSYLPGTSPIKLNSQDLIEIAGIKFYFLLPSRSIFDTAAARKAILLPPLSSSSLNPTDYHGQQTANDCGHSNDENGLKISSDRNGTSLVKQNMTFSADPSAGTLDGCVSMLDIQSAEKDTDNQQLLLEEEKDVVTCVADLISDLSGPKKWVPMGKLQSELVERFGKDWSHGKVSRYLPQKGMSGSSTEADGSPWSNLWTLLRKYPEQFVMAKVTRGEEIFEFVGLVHLVYVEDES